MTVHSQISQGQIQTNRRSKPRRGVDLENNRHSPKQGVKNPSKKMDGHWSQQGGTDIPVKKLYRHPSEHWGGSGGGRGTDIPVQMLTDSCLPFIYGYTAKPNFLEKYNFPFNSFNF